MSKDTQTHATHLLPASPENTRCNSGYTVKDLEDTQQRHDGRDECDHL